MPVATTRVLIVGGGLGGLVLAILLQRAGIDYVVLEQSVLIRPIGSLIVLSPLVLPLMEQLGLLEEIERLAKPFGTLTILRDDLSVVARAVLNDKTLDSKERYGHYDQCIPRPDLYNILLARIPKNRLHLGKRFVNFQHINLSNPHLSTTSSLSGSSYSLGGPEFEKIKARCSDGTFYHADILVGADGASSAVRQTLYRQLKEEGTLPKPDQEDQQYKQVALVGVTNALSPIKYPDLKHEFSHFKIILNRNSPYMTWYMPVPGNRYGWLVTRTLDEPVTINSGNSSYADWGPDATDEMSKAVRHLIGPDGGTVGDLIDSTDRHLLSKVMLEERTFKTWYGGRTVLIGDACHKSVPFTAKGANESILDAVTLASLLYDMPPTNHLEDFHRVFRAYQQSRAAIAKQVVETSSQFSALLVKEGWLGDLMRKVAFGIHATFKGRQNMDKLYAQRTQATFLPFVKERGSVPSRPQAQARKGLARQDHTPRCKSVGHAKPGVQEEHAQVDEFMTMGPDNVSIDM
ncbi:hypothetical protein BGZ75_008098 [Mortierella antarctica]|nr:hypothetical protein BGZ67_003699 [Mortierella alpina]KAF9990929.1 hypothetical protein BGZ75_008098 [Mortierella antarctica]